MVRNPLQKSVLPGDLQGSQCYEQPWLPGLQKEKILSWVQKRRQIRRQLGWLQWHFQSNRIKNLRQAMIWKNISWYFKKVYSRWSHQSQPTSVKPGKRKIWNWEELWSRFTRREALAGGLMPNLLCRLITVRPVWGKCKEDVFSLKHLKKAIFSCF